MSAMAHAAQGPAGAGPPAERRVHVVQGEQHVTSAPEVMLTTILGSCVAACLFDPVAKVGGMNHFLLPGDAAAASGVRHGVHAMELLVNALLRAGASRGRLQGKLFGGERLVEGLTDVGAQNADFAEDFLRREGVNCAGGSLRGVQARRVQFWPVVGRARQLQLAPTERQVFDVERPRRAAPEPDDGDVELF